MPLALLPTPKKTPLKPSAASAPTIAETDLDRILKMIPTEVIAFYTAAAPLGAYGRYLPLVFFLIGFAAVPVILYVDGKHTNVPAKAPQYMMRMLAFVAWAIAISWPFSAWSLAEHFTWLRAFGVILVPLIGAIVLRNTTPAGGDA